MADTTVAYSCPNCGGPLEFAPGEDKVKCPYCDTEFDVKTVEELFQNKQKQAAAAQEAKEVKWDTADAGGEWSEEEASAMQTFTCSSCGAEIVTDGNTMATECAYCGNPTMVPSRFSGMLKPDLVIPFQKTKDDAIAALKQFYQGKLLLPGLFTKANRIKEIQPMYVPFWLFDSDVNASATYKTTNTREYESGDDIVTETDYYECNRAGTMRFEKIPVDGSERMDDEYMESIEPFDYSELVPFSAAYLTGFLADKYDVDAQASAPRADKRVEKSALGVLEDTVTGYDSVNLQSSAVIKEHGKVQYAMVPVWILTTRYEDKPYTFMMNGQTGKVVGSLPIDKKKAFLYPLLPALISLPILYFIVKFLMAYI